MPRASRPEEQLPAFERLLAVGDGAPTLDQKVDMARRLRVAIGGDGCQLDRALLERIAEMRTGLDAAQAVHQELRELLDRLAAPPWYPATYLRAVDTELGARAMVFHGGARRIVGLAQGVALGALVPGEEVFLGSEGNVVTGRSSYGTPRYGDTALFDRLTPDGRCMIRWHDDEIVVDAAAGLDVRTLATGDLLRWDRAVWMAFEKLDAAAGRRFLLDEVPDIGRDHVAGQEANLDTLLSALTATLVAPARAAAYGLSGRQSILLVGPPGCGKTLMARIAAAEIARLSGKTCRFGVVKPSEWESPLVGVTQQNIRACFKALREPRDGLAVLFLDEIEAVGRIRGDGLDPHGDKFLAALLAELDGFVGRSDVAIIAATNRKTLVDPALLERLSDVEIAVGRPDLRGARQIFTLHLPDTVPMRDGAAAAERRAEIIETAVSRLYSPNADNALCTLRFRDGSARIVTARELASGRLIEQICRAARREAFRREICGEAPGMSVADMELAVGHALARLATTLTPRNAAEYLVGLPQDVDVVSVEPVTRRLARSYRYHRAA